MPTDHLAEPSASPDALRRGGIGGLGYFSLAVGSIVGSAWVLVLGEWLGAAGPGGVGLGFVAGGIAMVLIGLCYGELAARCSVFGGEFVYVLRTLGRFPAFLVGWFLTLYALSMCAFEGIAIASLLTKLVPAAAGPVLYHVGPMPVRDGALAIGLCGVAVIGALHFAGVSSAIRFQNIATVGFLVVLASVMVAGLTLGSSANWHPLFYSTTGHSVPHGVLWMFSLSALFLNGWQTALHAIEERKPGVSVRKAVVAMIVGIAVGAITYCGIVISASSCVPWRALVGKDLPGVTAYAALIPGGFVGNLMIVIALLSALKAWNAFAWVATRLVVAQAREGFLPRRLARLHPRSGAPGWAVVLVTVLSTCGPLLGRVAVVPIVDMGAICLALSMVSSLIVLLRRRKLNLEIPTFTVPGGVPVIITALAAATLMIAIAFIEPLLTLQGPLPVEWKLLGIWTAAGVVLWLGFGRRARAMSASLVYEFGK